MEEPGGSIERLRYCAGYRDRDGRKSVGSKDCQKVISAKSLTVYVNGQ
jgi:hypothetical protein